jgi:hypothetical protein
VKTDDVVLGREGAGFTLGIEVNQHFFTGRNDLLKRSAVQ